MKRITPRRRSAIAKTKRATALKVEDNQSILSKDTRMSVRAPLNISNMPATLEAVGAEIVGPLWNGSGRGGYAAGRPNCDEYR
jgi:hypothetical protein